MREALETADLMYEERDPYLRDVIVDNNVLIDLLELKGIGWKHNNRFFESDSIDSNQIDLLYKTSLN